MADVEPSSVVSGSIITPDNGGEIALFTATLTSLLSSLSAQQSATIAALTARVSTLQASLDASRLSSSAALDDLLDEKIKALQDSGLLPTTESAWAARERSDLVDQKVRSCCSFVDPEFGEANAEHPEAEN